ncbi:J domain-containing protein [Culicoidibacter larvae]|uniref:J domain-containing protein n=1 Tax=Culicoidibacter larvae TaxID=2579976 RepID=A0A5R8QGX0_9FIRM|nr:J domain-containing protein [Culicoidibacter larvae]TLG77238.1 hypothetical protein FEZ08_01075 [Culicoidibacter larvae]
MDHLYELLGIEPTYDTAKIREAYYEKQKLIASDKSVSFSELYSAYEKLIEYAEKMAETTKESPQLATAVPQAQAVPEAVDTENQRRLAAAIQVEAQRKAAAEQAERVQRSAVPPRTATAKKLEGGSGAKAGFSLVLVFVIVAIVLAVNFFFSLPEPENTSPQPKQVSYFISE